MARPRRRKLGRSPLEVAPIALGGNVFGWTTDERRSFEVLDAFVDAGFNLIDTADVYSIWVSGHRGGESEAILGRWFAERGRRDEVVLATKVGMDMGPGGRGLGPEHIRRSVEASLQRLRTDRIDLYQAHQDDPATPLEPTLEAFAGLVNDGRVRVLGASNYPVPRLRDALDLCARRGWPRFESIQPRYNLVDREEFEGALEGLCVDSGIGVITYSSLASGFLSGKYRSAADAAQSPRGARIVQRYLNERGTRILEAVHSVASRRGTSPAAVALAWLLQRPTVTAPIVSATSVVQLREILGAATLDLDREDLATLDRAGVGSGN
jgi:aryl-alcohol dehydrogenase-like predicted oxidoreductase